jgi:nitrous oxidase accessory protein NosD
MSNKFTRSYRISKSGANYFGGDQGSGIRDQGPEIRNQGTGIRNQGSEISDQGSGVRNNWI